MTIESLVFMGAITLFLLLVAIYANKHRAEDHKKDSGHKPNAHA